MYVYIYTYICMYIYIYIYIYIEYISIIVIITKINPKYQSFDENECITLMIIQPHDRNNSID